MRAEIKMDPDAVRLQAFTIEMATSALEQQLPTGTVAILGGRPAGDILRDLAAMMRQGAGKAETEFKSRLNRKEERRTNRATGGGGGGKGRGRGGQPFDFDEEFPGAAAFNQGEIINGGGAQAPPTSLTPPGVGSIPPPPPDEVQVSPVPPGVPSVPGDLTSKAFDPELMT